KCRYPVGERPVMTTWNQYCLIRPLYGLIEFPRQQMCERPVGVECPTLGIVGAEFDRLVEERDGFSEAPFVGKRISKTAMDNRQIGIELDGYLQFGQCVGVGSARNQRAPVYETDQRILVVEFDGLFRNRHDVMEPSIVGIGFEIRHAEDEG